MSDDNHDATPTLGPDATIRSNYVLQRYDRTIERTISFRPATMERDLGRLHTWLGYDHVAEFWTLDISLPAFRDHLAEKLAEDHLTPYIGYIDHVPMSYWEVYWPSEYELDAYYDADPSDRAAHLLIGPPEYVNNGYAEAHSSAPWASCCSHTLKRNEWLANPTSRTRSSFTSWNSVASRSAMSSTSKKPKKTPC